MTKEIKDIRVNGERLWESIMTMAKIGPGEKGGSRRLALTDVDKQGRDLFVNWCEQEGCTITVDDMGNIFARRPGKNNNLDPICAGSHLDTQPHGGKFDGIYGVLSALEVIRTLNENDIQTEAPIEAINWTNEEGSRFAPAMIASGVFAGLFEKEFAYNRTDSDGKTLRQELERIGYLGDVECGDHPIRALFESHIEQGPILEKSGDQVGVVIGGQGQRWFDITLKGQDSHAGSTPMVGRRDALVASAKLIQSVQIIALDFAPHGVATVGEMRVTPNSRNTIPGEVFLSVDIRNPDDENLSKMAQRLHQSIQSIAASDNIEIESDEIWYCPPIQFDSNCISAVSNATKSLGYRHQEIVSGAGHDACQVCRIVPTSMIFVPCEDGLSHNEEENAEPEDLEAGCNVLLQAMVAMAN
jgi:N-carbamoyl-L-amino-acid hydrolase